MATLVLTPGQERVRAIAAAHLDQFDADTNSDDLPVYSLLRDALAADSVIRHDPLTSATFTDATISTNYLRWLEATRTPTTPTSMEVTYTNIVLQGSVGGNWGTSTKPLYTGGYRWCIVMRAILTLAAGGAVGGPRPVYDYYQETDLLVGQDGNHRLLGHMLMGASPLPHVKYWQEPRNVVAMRAAYATAEAWWCDACASLPERNTVFVDHEKARRSLDARSLDDASRVLVFSDTSAEEQGIIAAYVRHVLTAPRGEWLRAVPGATSQMHGVLFVLDELRTLHQRTPWQRRMLAFQRKLDRELSLSAFEQWYVANR